MRKNDGILTKSCNILRNNYPFKIEATKNT